MHDPTHAQAPANPLIMAPPSDQRSGFSAVDFRENPRSITFVFVG